MRRLRPLVWRPVVPLLMLVAAADAVAVVLVVPVAEVVAAGPVSAVPVRRAAEVRAAQWPRRPVVRELPAADVQPVQWPPFRRARVVPAADAPEVVALRVQVAAAAVEGRAGLESPRAASATGRVMRPILRWSSS